MNRNKHIVCKYIDHFKMNWNKEIVCKYIDNLNCPLTISITCNNKVNFYNLCNRRSCNFHKRNRRNSTNPDEHNH